MNGGWILSNGFLANFALIQSSEMFQMGHPSTSLVSHIYGIVWGPPV